MVRALCPAEPNQVDIGVGELMLASGFKPVVQCLYGLRAADGLGVRARWSVIAVYQGE